MSTLFDKNDFNISIKKINNGILCDLLSWEINYFDNEIITFDIKNSENLIRYNFLKSNIISKLISSD